MKERIYLSSPHMGGDEMTYIQEAFATNWIAPLGKNVDDLEKEMAQYIGMGHAAALSSGTAAIHLGLKWLGVQSGDFVFCSSLTFSGSCNSILYEKAQPVFIDSEPDSLNMSPVALEKAFVWAKSKGKLPKAVIIVDLYGAPADYDALLPICKHYGVPVLEDAAEALGATYGGKKVGAFGALSALSFNGNKIITTSGGGMLLSDDEQAIAKARFWATQSRDPAPHYQHSEIGYNYRMSNICAGIGLGQMHVLEDRVRQKRAIHATYCNKLADSALMPFTSKTGEPTYWLTIALLQEKRKVSVMDIYNALQAENIESRPLWKPMHMQPVFANCPFFSHNEGTTSIAEAAFSQGICLPSDSKMTVEQQQEVIRIIKKALAKS